MSMASMEIMSTYVKEAGTMAEEEQRQMAQLLFDELADRAWEEPPELATAIEEARAEIARDEVMDFKDYDRTRPWRPLLHLTQS